MNVDKTNEKYLSKNVKKPLYIVIYSLSIALLLSTPVTKAINKIIMKSNTEYVLRIENTLDEPSYTIFDDNSILIAYNEHNGSEIYSERSQSYKTVIIRKKENRIIFKKEYESIGSFYGARFYRIKGSNMFYIFLSTKEGYTLYTFSLSGDKIHKKIFSFKDYKKFYFENEKLFIIYKNDKEYTKFSYNLLSGKETSEKHTEPGENEFHEILNSNYYFKTYDVDEKKKKVIIFNNKKEELIRFDYEKRSLYLNRMVMINNKIIAVYKSKLYIIDPNEKTIKKKYLFFTRIIYVDYFENRLRLWGITNTFLGEKFSTYNINKNFKISKKIFYRVVLDRYYFMHKVNLRYDTKKNAVVSGLTLSEQFFFRVNQDNELLRAWQ